MVDAGRRRGGDRIVSGLAEHGRGRRRNLDRPGWMPWTLLQILASLTAVLAIALALKN
jgi:hypothetical protein